MDSLINSEIYWNDHFLDQKDTEVRKAQTEFFMSLVVDNLPAWIADDIQENHMSVCDAGCASGIGTEALKRAFRESDVFGFDFSQYAVEQAQETYPDCTFFKADIKNLDKIFDVVVCSNVLEHFYDAELLLKKVVGYARNYCILLLPFREYYTISEHQSYFDFKSFPLEINDRYELCFFKPMTMNAEQEKYWFGEQILVVYANKEQLASKKCTLRNLYNGYIEERTKIIQYYTEILNNANTRLSDMDNQLSTFQEQLASEQSELLDTKTQLANAQSELLDSKTQLANAQSELLDSKTQLANAQSELLDTHEQLMREQKALISLQENLLATESKLKAIAAEKQAYIAEYETQIEELTSRIHSYEQFAADDYTAIREAAIIIGDQQLKRSYKVYLALKRLKAQFFVNRQIKDFCKWVMNVVFKTKYSAHAIHDFDALRFAKYPLLNRMIAHENFSYQKLEFLPAKYWKQTARIFIFATVPVYDVGGGQRCAQLAKIFNQMGFQVHYIYGFPCTESAPVDIFIPAITHRYVEEVSLGWFQDLAQEGDLAIFELPFYRFEPYMDLALKKKCYTVYEHIDNWDTSLGSMFYQEDVFRHFLDKVDLITVTAKMLGEKIQENSDREYVYLPNAVNSDLFEPKMTYKQPEDLRIGKKTLLYFGSLWGEWFDWEKIDYVARHCPGVAINLIGDDAGCQEQKQKMPTNVYFLGIKEQTALPAYLRYSDIALLPFTTCEIGKYVSPLKIFEYIAMNVRVLSTSLDDIQNYPNVTCLDTKEEWAEMVNGPLPEVVDASSFVSNNNWYARCEVLLHHAGQVKVGFPKVSIIVLNRNNMNCIFRCVDSLLSYQARYGYEIIVVDNDSSDGSYEKLGEMYKDKIILLRNSRNGCSSGRNLGASKAMGEYIFFLDSDQWVVSERWLDNYLDILCTNPKIGAVSWGAGWFLPNQVNGPITDYYPNRAMSNPKRMYRDDVAYLATDGFLIKKELFDKIGGFDEYYDPTCFEDTDLALKVRDAGYELAYTPYGGIMHLPHQTTKSGSAAHKARMKRNGDYFRDKWTKMNPRLLEYYYTEIG